MELGKGREWVLNIYYIYFFFWIDRSLEEELSKGWVVWFWEEKSLFRKFVLGVYEEGKW